MTEGKYWQDFETEADISLPKGYVLYENFESIVEYYKKDELFNLTELEENLKENHVIGFLDTLDVVHFYIDDNADITDLVSFFGFVLGCMALEAKEPNGADTYSLVAETSYKLAAEIRDQT